MTVYWELRQIVMPAADRANLSQIVEEKTKKLQKVAEVVNPAVPRAAIIMKLLTQEVAVEAAAIASVANSLPSPPGIAAAGVSLSRWQQGRRCGNVVK